MLSQTMRCNFKKDTGKCCFSLPPLVFWKKSCFLVTLALIAAQKGEKFWKKNLTHPLLSCYHCRRLRKLIFVIVWTISETPSRLFKESTNDSYQKFKGLSAWHIRYMQRMQSTFAFFHPKQTNEKETYQP